MQSYYPIIFEPSKKHHIFYDKNTPQEIAIALFGECNLRCSFCVDNLRFAAKCKPETFKYTIQLFEKAVKYTQKSNIIVRIFGGELFQDKFDDSIYHAYDDFIKQIISILKDNYKQYSIEIASNLIHNKKRQQVLDLLTKHSIKLNGSFDLVGRFKSKKLARLFVENCQFYVQRNIPIEIGFVASRENMHAIMHRGENIDIFEELYNQYSIDFDYYSPNSHDTRQITEEELSEFILYCYKHYPKLDNIQLLINSYKRQSTEVYPCPGILIAQNKLIYSCCNFEEASKTYIKNKQCFACPHLNYCPHPCIRLMSGHKGCHVKALFDYLIDHEK